MEVKSRDMMSSKHNISERPEDNASCLQSVDICDPKIIEQGPDRYRKSPIMVELTDVNVSKVDLARALEAGMNVCKFKMSASTKNDKVRMFMRMEKAAERCAVKKGLPVCPIGTCSDYDHISNLKTGQEISIGYEASVVMHCLHKVNEKSIKCKIDKEGQIWSMDTAFFRNYKNTTPFIAQTDIKILKFILRYQVDILFVYYAKDGAMIKKIKTLISKALIKPMIYAAICNQDGIDNLEELIQESDGIIMCRDILELELLNSDKYRLPILQKWMAGKCLEVGKPFYINAVFERASKFGMITDSEIADVSNALWDGVSGFILKDYNDIEKTETALKSLDKICCQVEPLTCDRKMFWRVINKFPMPVNASEAAVISSVIAANQTNARVLIISSVSGETARMMLCLRPACIVIAVCERMHAARVMYCCRNIVPIIYKGGELHKSDTEEARIQFAAEFAVSKQWMEYGDMYVTLQRSYEGHLFCDVVKVMTVTFARKMLVECHYGSDDDEDKESKDSLVVQEPKKKRRKRKKKHKVEETKQEEKIEEEEKDDDKKSEIHITYSVTASKMTTSENYFEEQKQEEDEDEKDEEDD
ncbi:hypothetical protein O0L34_g4245 [Tuta absoluta]|nr:hypothetical protein O0L34_g4245 [Tuta absoluta]